jgi:poly-gamma-glutamate synthesis protein (capsule biosynthesis protein)
MQHQAQIDAAYQDDGSYDYSHCFSLVKEHISHADIAIGNLEVTLGGEPYRGYPQFSAPDEYLYAMKEAGFDILATANNHSLDRHRKGLERTLTLIDSIGLIAVGT